jgi:hypothetical protein
MNENKLFPMTDEAREVVRGAAWDLGKIVFFFLSIAFLVDLIAY